MCDEITKLEDENRILRQELEEAKFRYDMAEKQISKLAMKLALTEEDCRTLEQRIPKEM